MKLSEEPKMLSDEELIRMYVAGDDRPTSYVQKLFDHIAALNDELEPYRESQKQYARFLEQDANIVSLDDQIKIAMDLLHGNLDGPDGAHVADILMNVAREREGLRKERSKLLDEIHGHEDTIVDSDVRLIKLKQKVLDFYDVLKHGDEEHQRWLRDMVNEHFGLEA